jgi:thiol-disulfide isomerase/thioredoxin
MRIVPTVCIASSALWIGLALLAVPAGPAWALDADLAALSVTTGDRDEAALNRARRWAEAGATPERAAHYLDEVRGQAFAQPRDVEAVRHYIEVAKSQNRADQVTAELEEYAAANPERAEAHYYLGLARPEEGKSRFEKSLEIDPRFYHGLVGSASAELASDAPDLVRAKSRLLEAARLEPSEPLAFIVLEQLYRQTGDSESQILALSKAVEADPWDGRLRQSLLRQLQSQAQATQDAGGDMATWAAGTTDLLLRLARTGPGLPELAVAAARIAGALNDPAKVLDHLSVAADLGFADPRGLELDRVLASAISGHPRTAPILEKMSANRTARRDELKAQALEGLITVPTPPVATIPLLGGGTLDLGSKRGKVVVLDFWATWCGPCRRALPVVQKLHEKQMKDVEIYCVNVFERDGGAQIEGFWKSGGYPMPVALGTQDWATAFGVSSIPTLFLIGPDGQVRYRHQGFSPYLDEELAWIAEGLLEND